MYCGRPFMIERCWTDLSRTRLCPVGCSESAPGPLAQRGHAALASMGSGTESQRGGAETCGGRSESCSGGICAEDVRDGEAGLS